MKGFVGPQRRGRALSGFTLVEVLAVIAIIGTLVGLLLPAVQVAREAARRSACTNNLKQLALGCNTYESTNGGYPGFRDWKNQTTSGATKAQTWSFLIYVMPFLEQAETYDSALTYFKTNANGQGESDWRGTLSAGRRIAGLVCPSDRMGASTATNWPTNYRACAGDMMTKLANQASYPHEAQQIGASNGYARDGTSPRSAIGISFPKKITDGLSKTVLVGEAVIGDGSASRLSGAATVTGYDWHCLPQDCLAATFTANTNNNIGQVWTSARAGHTWFFNTLPPNGPRCNHHNGVLPQDAGVPASSYHGGGAIVAMCDGAVRFIEETIDTNGSQNLNDPCTSTTPCYKVSSRWGVWGAMATPALGDTYSY